MKRFRFWFCVLIFAWSSAAIPAWSKAKYVRCVWWDAPATSITIAWHQASGKNPVLHFDTQDKGANAAHYTFSRRPQHRQAKGMNHQFVRLEGLRPATAYFFVIKDSDGVSRRFWFRTASAHSSDRLSIIAGGDSRNHRQSRRNANLLVAKLRADCVLFGGDMTAADTDWEWRDWLADWELTIAADGRVTPIVPARGNHERSNASIVALFDAPHPDLYYAFNIGGDLVRIYTLNTLAPIAGAQTDWLRADLAAHGASAMWRIAQYHHPMRPHTRRKHEGDAQYENWARLFFDQRVQLVVECDAHVCKTTWAVRPSQQRQSEAGFVRDDVNGTVYIGEGCWGAPLRPANDNKTWTRNSGSFNQFSWIWVNADRIEVRTVLTDNAQAVGWLTDENRFELPSSLQIWKPSNGEVIRLQRRTAATRHGQY